MNKVIANNSNIIELVKKGIEKYGNEANLNYIDVSKVENMDYIFEKSYLQNNLPIWYKEAL